MNTDRVTRSRARTQAAGETREWVAFSTVDCRHCFVGTRPLAQAGMSTEVKHANSWCHSTPPAPLQPPWRPCRARHRLALPGRPGVRPPRPLRQLLLRRRSRIVPTTRQLPLWCSLMRVGSGRAVQCCIVTVAVKRSTHLCFCRSPPQSRGLNASLLHTNNHLLHSHLPSLLLRAAGGLPTCRASTRQGSGVR
jgi:hypothetical protein